MTEAVLGVSPGLESQEGHSKLVDRLLVLVRRLRRSVRDGNPRAVEIQDELSSVADDPVKLVQTLHRRASDIETMTGTDAKDGLDESMVLSLPDFSGNIGSERAGRIKHYFDGPAYAWNPLNMISRGIDGAEQDIDLLLNPEVSRDYVANVLHDLLVVASLRKPFSSVEKHDDFISNLIIFREEVADKLHTENTMNAEAINYCEVLGALASYCIDSYAFEVQAIIPENNKFGPREVYFEPFSLPEVLQELFQMGVRKTEVEVIIQTLVSHLDYSGSPRQEEKKKNIVGGCREAELAIQAGPITLSSLMQIHIKLMGDDPSGGVVDTTPNSLNLFKGQDVGRELLEFEGDLNEAVARVSSDVTDEEALLIATDLMRKWTAIHATADGNGRLSRIIADIILSLAGKPLIPISIENKWLHRRAIEEAQEQPEALVHFFEQQQIIGVLDWDQLADYEASR